MVGSTASVDDDTQEDEADEREDLDHRVDDLGFTVTSDTHHVHEERPGEEDGDPYGRRCRRVPVLTKDIKSNEASEKMKKKKKN